MVYILSTIVIFGQLTVFIISTYSVFPALNLSILKGYPSLHFFVYKMTGLDDAF